MTSGTNFEKIVQHVTLLRHEVETKAELGLTDLNKYCEDFIKELFNHIYGYKLRNLNQKPNFPGIEA